MTSMSSYRGEPAVRSYTVKWTKDDKPEIIPSHWSVGYTPAHQETTLEAAAFEYGKVCDELTKQETRKQELEELLVKLETEATEAKK